MQERRNCIANTLELRLSCINPSITGQSMPHTLLDDGQIDHTEVGVHDAATDRFPLALTTAARAETAVVLAEQQTDTASGEYTLLHGETLLVVAPGDAQTVTLQNHNNNFKGQD